MVESRSLHRQFGFRWAEELECSQGVYLRRWVLETPAFSFRLHHWLRSDDDRAFHDHPWGFHTLILKGKYHDCSPATIDNQTYPVVMELMTPGKIKYRPAEHKHYVLVEPPGCWTLLWTGPKSRRWGFWLKNRFVISYRYFYQMGRHICD